MFKHGDKITWNYKYRDEIRSKKAIVEGSDGNYLKIKVQANSIYTTLVSCSNCVKRE